MRKDMPEEMLEKFTNAMINGKIIESLQMCIYRFDIGDDTIRTQRRNKSKYLKNTASDIIQWMVYQEVLNIYHVVINFT